MGIAQTKQLTPTSMTFGGADSLKDLPKDIKYNDDEDFITKEYSENKKMNQKDEDINEYINLKDKINISSKSEYKALNLTQTSKINSNLLVTVKVDEIKSSTKTSIDLICVIDRSWSMKGIKLDLVKESFKYLLECLDERDRLCIIVFDNEIERLCPLLCMNEANKSKITELINKVVAKGGTNISTAIQHAVEVIKKRENNNNVTSIFLLSDGIDNDADKKIKNLLDKEKFFLGLGEVADAKDNNNCMYHNIFSINTFGYGSDHDAKLMTNISKLADGNYYFIDDIKLIDESFLGCLAGLVSVIAQDVVLKIIPNQKACTIKIPKGLENTFMFDASDSSYCTKILHLISGRSFNFLFEIELNLAKATNYNMAYLDLCDISCSFNGLRENGYQSFFISTKSCVMILTEEDKLSEEENINPDVVFHYYRLKLGECLRKAKVMSDEGNYQGAKNDLESLLTEVKMKLKVANSPELQNLSKDLEQALIYLDPDYYKKDGRHFIVQSYDCQLREKHNLKGFNLFASSGQERFISSHRQKKLFL